MLIIAILVFGMVVGGLAQLLLGKRMQGVNWPLAFVAGIFGSFLGGLLISLLAGDGIELRPSGIIGSIAGAVIITAAYTATAGRSSAK
ncbi:MAG: GlsB/YeaQ/YmgE family stress response membrane protein [Cumulibacter sp.]